MPVNSITGVFTALTVIVGGICILLLVSTKTLRDSRDDMEVRIKQLEEERARDKEQIASQKTELGIWRSAVTGERQLESISGLLNLHHEEARQHWTQVMDVLTHVDQTMAQLATTLEGNSG